jgi:hypothetical protein
MGERVFNTPVDSTTKCPTICRKPGGFIVNSSPKNVGIMVDILYLPGMYMIYVD